MFSWFCLELLYVKVDLMRLFILTVDLLPMKTSILMVSMTRSFREIKP